MNNKITIAILSVLTIFFLTAQTCSFGTTASGLAADCEGEGDIICDDDNEAWECGLAAYGTGYYVSRASEYDVSECGATDTTDTDADGVYDSDDICEGYDDALDNDADGTPDGCDTDDDDDGYTDRIEIRAGSDPNDASDIPATRCTSDCGAYACDERAAACYSSCTDDDECTDGYTCDTTYGTGVCTGGYEITTACIETGDSGEDYYTAGSVTGTSYYDGTEVTWSDFCDGDGNLVEYWCPGSGETYEGYAYGEVVTCPSGYNCVAGACSDDLDADGVPDTDDVCEGYDDSLDTDTDGTPDGCDEDADGDGLLNSIEEEIGLDPTTDELSSYEVLNFDPDSIDFAPENTDADSYIEYFGPITATIKGKVTGGVATAIDADWGTTVDLTDTTSNDYITIRPPSTATDYFDLSTWFVIKARVKGAPSASGAVLIINHPVSSTSSDYQLALGILNDGVNNYYATTLENADGTSVNVFGGTPSDTQWQEVVVAYSGSSLYLFVDGDLVDTPETGATLMSSTEPLFLGFKNPGDTSSSETLDYEGHIASIQIWGE